MAVDAGVVEGMARRITTLWPSLNERQRRLLLGVEARELGWGGVSTVATAMGIAVPHRIGRHVHPQARPDLPSPAATSTGIDYLALVAAQTCV